MPPLRDFLRRFRPAGSPGQLRVRSTRGSVARASGGGGAGAGAAGRRSGGTRAHRYTGPARCRGIVSDAWSAADALTADAAWRARAMHEQAARRVMTAAREQAARAVGGGGRQAADGAGPAAGAALVEPRRASSACRPGAHECRVGRRLCPGQGPGPAPARAPSGPAARGQPARSRERSRCWPPPLTTRPARAGQTLAATQHAVAATLLWDLRVLAGWLPRDGVDLLRALACWFEIANVDELLAVAAGRPAGGGIPAGCAGHRLAPAAPGGQPHRPARCSGRFAVAVIPAAIPPWTSVSACGPAGRPASRRCGDPARTWAGGGGRAAAGRRAVRGRPRRAARGHGWGSRADRPGGASGRHAR